MSMPNIPNITPIINIDREKAINMLMASIAMEEIGLSNIINAESEKIKYILNPHKCKSASIQEIKEVNQSVEKVMRNVMKIQFLLQDKLENIINVIPKEQTCPNPDCNEYTKSKCKPKCKECTKNKCEPDFTIIGNGHGRIDNNCDPFNYGIFNIESNIKQVKDCFNLSLKYTICKNTKKHNILVLLLAIPESMSFYCIDNLESCNNIKNFNEFIIKGQGVMSLSSKGKLLQQSTVDFTCTIFDYKYIQKLRMITTSSNILFNYDSGVLLIKSGHLKINKSIP